MEVSSQLKTNGSQEIQSDVKDDVQENHEDLESESHIKPEVLPADSDVMVEECKEGAGESDVHLLVKSDKIMDVEDETIEQKQKGEALFIMINLLIHSINVELLINLLSVNRNAFLS